MDNDPYGLTLEALGRKGSSQKNASMPRNPPDKSSDIFLRLNVKLYHASNYGSLSMNFPKEFETVLRAQRCENPTTKTTNP